MRWIAIAACLAAGPSMSEEKYAAENYGIGYFGGLNLLDSHKCAQALEATRARTGDEAFTSLFLNGYLAGVADTVGIEKSDLVREIAKRCIEEPTLTLLELLSD